MRHDARRWPSVRHAQYVLDVQTTPSVIKAGAPFKMRFDVRHPSSGNLVRDFEAVHDKRYHLFVVSHDMTEFQHLHPDQQPDGSWTIEAVLPRAGAYRLCPTSCPQARPNCCRARSSQL